MSTGLWKKEMLQYRDTLVANDQMAVRLELYNAAAREGRVAALKNGCGIGVQNDYNEHVTGSFRQLTVD